MPYLVLGGGEGHTEQRIGIDTSPFRIGRLPQSHLVLTDPLASRSHCQILRSGEGFVLEDLKSANGTFVNGARVENHPLRDGDEIRIGGVTARFRAEGPPAPAPATTPLVSPFAPERIRPVESLQGSVFLRDGASGDGKASSAFVTLYQLCKALIAASSTEQVLEAALGLLFQAVPAERAVLLLRGTGGGLEPKLARSRFSKDPEPDTTVSRTIAEKAARERAAILTSDAQYDPRFQSGESISNFHIRSALAVPIWESNRTLGALYVDNRAEAYAFTEDDLELLTAVGNLIALALKQEEYREVVRKEAVLRSNLERYLSPQVAELIVQRSAELERVTLEVQEQQVTVLFSDIVGFTPLAERLSAGDVAWVLNGYFNRMSEIIFRHKGSINKYIGDAIMAIFGAPLSLPNDPAHAVTAALEMIQGLEEYNQTIDEKKRFAIRIGINTGGVVAGTIGSHNRMEYTVLGDAVNVASRLEGKARPNHVLVGRGTYERVKNFFEATPMGFIALKGRRQKVEAFEVLGARPGAPLP